CCRFVYNQTLAYRKEVYEKEKKSVRACLKKIRNCLF
ncbi:helix-turn-helix domain-containing protein, partial [Faecalicatena fissicatena]